MEQPASARLSELRGKLDRLYEEIVTFPENHDQKAYVAFRQRFHDWHREMHGVLEPYPDAWELMTATVRTPKRLHRTLNGLAAAVAIYQRRLATVMHGWTD
jgi:hypothetical protein